MKNENLYEAEFNFDIYPNGRHRKVKTTVLLTKEEKNQHDALIKNIEDAILEGEDARKNYKEHELLWEKLEKDNSFLVEYEKLVKINTELSYKVTGAKSKLATFEYDWKRRRGYYEYEIDYPDYNPEIEAAEEEMRRWDEEDPTWRIANDLD